MIENSKENKSVWIIRWNKAVQWEDGKWSTVIAKAGSYDEVELFAQQIAKKHDVKIEVIT